MDEREAMGLTAAWARQCIVNAMSIRDADMRQRGNNPGFARLAMTEAHHLTDELWQETLREYGERTPVPKLRMAYVRKVFEWCYNHMHRGASRDLP